jgi:hypothetical protein
VTDRLDPGGGGMTGATGDLTPDESAEPFTPGERREIDDPEQRGRVTHEQAIRGPGTAADAGDPGWGPDTGDSTDAPRDAGYGSTHGLSSDDDAYRMEHHAPPPAADADRQQIDGGEPRLGVDETIAAEDDRF